MTLVYLLIRAEHGKEGIVKAAMSKFSEIIEIHEVFGRYDIIAKVETEDQQKFSPGLFGLRSRDCSQSLNSRFNLAYFLVSSLFPFFPPVIGP